MKHRAMAVAAMFLFVALAVLPALAGDEPREVQLSGWIVDEWCGAKNANAEGAGCAKSCAENGAALVLFSDGKLFKLSDQKTAKEHIGHEVVVSGKLTEDTVEVASIVKAGDGA